MFPKFPNARTMLAAFALAGVPVAAHAQRATMPERWVLVSSTDDGDSTYADRESLTRSGDRVTVWIATTTATPSTDAYGTKYAKLLSRDTYDCKARTVLPAEWVSYTKAGAVLKSGDASRYNPHAWAVVPGSIGEHTLDTVCTTLKP